MMVEPFENEARLMYNSMVVNVSRNLISANNVASQFGIHVIYANNFSPKLNAYPTNPSLSLPSRDDVRLFESGDQSGLSQDVIRFLNAYYVPAKTQYRDSFRTVFFNEELNNIGTLKFNDTAQLVAFNEFVRASARQALIQFDPRSI
jgi:hypothetical protein